MKNENGFIYNEKSGCELPLMIFYNESFMKTLVKKFNTQKH